MEVDYVLVDGVMVFHRIVRIKKDNNSLFSALAYHVYNNEQMGPKVRLQIVQYVSTNWNLYQIFSSKPNGQSYVRCDEYMAEMAKPTTLGTVCELMAAGEIFPYHFQVYCSINKEILHTFGPFLGTVARLMLISDPLNYGHFDVLIPNDVHPRSKPKI